MSVRDRMWLIFDRVVAGIIVLTLYQLALVWLGR